MKRHIPTLSFVAIIALGVSTYFNFSNTSQTKRVLCQEETTTFEKIFFGEPIDKAKELLKSGNYILKSNIEYSKNMESKLLNKLNSNDLDNRFEQILNKYITKKEESADRLLIDYYLYENDKKDKNKKNDKAKEYAGYLMFEFKLHNNIIYKIQTDYISEEAKDIENRMNCALQSFETIK